MQSIIASCVYKNKSFDYINASFIYIIKACIYSFLMMHDRRLHADDVLRAVRLARYQVGGTQIHVSYGRGENYMYGLVIRDFQTMRGNHLAEADLAAQSLVIIPAALLRVCSHCAHNQGKHHQNLLHVRS